MSSGSSSCGTSEVACRNVSPTLLRKTMLASCGYFGPSTCASRFAGLVRGSVDTTTCCHRLQPFPAERGGDMADLFRKSDTYALVPCVIRQFLKCSGQVSGPASKLQEPRPVGSR